jgi:hypothetical protein
LLSAAASGCVVYKSEQHQWCCRFSVLNSPKEAGRTFLVRGRYTHEPIPITQALPVSCETYLAQVHRACSLSSQDPLRCSSLGPTREKAHPHLLRARFKHFCPQPPAGKHHTKKAGGARQPKKASKTTHTQAPRDTRACPHHPSAL